MLLCPNDTVRDELEPRCNYKGDIFKQIAMKNKQEKIEWLQNKQKNNFTNDTLVRDDGQQNKAH